MEQLPSTEHPLAKNSVALGGGVEPNFLTRCRAQLSDSCVDEYLKLNFPVEKRFNFTSEATTNSLTKCIAGTQVSCILIPSTSLERVKHDHVNEVC